MRTPTKPSHSRPMCNSGTSRNSPSAVNALQVRSAWMCGDGGAVEKFAVHLDGGDHAGHDDVAAELAPDFRPDARPGGRAQCIITFAGYLAVEGL